MRICEAIVNLFGAFFKELMNEYEIIKNKNHNDIVDVFFDKIYLIAFVSFFFVRVWTIVADLENCPSAVSLGDFWIFDGE